MQTHRCYIVVVDNGSTDDTPAISRGVADLVLEGGPERSAQRNQGAAATPATILGFIDSDMLLGPTIIEEAVTAIQSGAGAVIVPERTVGQGYWARVRAFERGFYEGSNAIEAARFYSRDVFNSAGGFDESLTGPEDWDLTVEARKRAPVVRISARIDHDEGQVRYLEACRKKGYYAEGLRRYVAKRGMGAVRDIAARPWLGQPARLVTPLGVGLIALKVGEAVAVSIALLGAERPRAQ
jgi:glycosyltransferase involved in cell wall biosynthesis